MRCLALTLLLLAVAECQAARLRVARDGQTVWLMANSTGRPFRLEMTTDFRTWTMLSRHPHRILWRIDPWFRQFYPTAAYRVVDENSDYRPTVMLR